MVFREIDDDLWAIVQNHLPSTKPHVGRPRCDPRRLFNGILYVLSTGCTWADVPAKYGTKSTVHRYHLELCEMGAYQAIFLDLLRSGYEIRRVAPPHGGTETRPAQAKQNVPPMKMVIKR
jgi:transposase